MVGLNFLLNKIRDGITIFLTEEIDYENGKLVALEQMILRDETLNELFDLKYGEEAERDFIGDKWNCCFKKVSC